MTHQLTTILRRFFFLFPGRDVRQPGPLRETSLQKESDPNDSAVNSDSKYPNVIFQKADEKMWNSFFFFFLSLRPELPISVLSACFSDISYTKNRDQECFCIDSFGLLWHEILLQCSLLNEQGTHVLSASHTHTHWYTMTDSCERITWYKIICYFQTIDLWVTQYNKSLSEASPQQSILTCSPIRCILIMWSMYLLWCWLHRKRASLSREESNKKTNMTRALLWDDIVLYVWASWDGDCGGTRLPWTSSIIQTSGKKPEYISLFIGMYFYISGSHKRPTLSYNKTWRSWYVRQQSYQQGTSFTDGVTSNGK